MNYKLMIIYSDSKILADSNTLYLSDTSGFQRDVFIVDSLNINASQGHNYVLEILLTDVNRKVSTFKKIEINKTVKGSRQYYLARNELGIPLFEDKMKRNQSFYLEVSGKTKNALYVRRFKTKFPIAKSPFSMFNEKSVVYKYDSTYECNLINGFTSLITLPSTGFYHFQMDTFVKNGFTLYRYYDDFPDLTSVKHLLPPLKYLANEKEFRNIMLQKNKKNAIDEYWINRAGNTDLARKMIKQYYNRVRKANTHFTSYTEGWKTDRGLVYIIYGPPIKVYKNDRSESWVYGESNTYSSVTFTFSKVNNYFTENDYKLIKSPVYKDSWYNMMNRWYR